MCTTTMITYYYFLKQEMFLGSTLTHVWSEDTSVWHMWNALRMLKILYSTKHQINLLQIAQIQFFIHFHKQK